MTLHANGQLFAKSTICCRCRRCECLRWPKHLQTPCDLHAKVVDTGNQDSG